MARYQFEGFEFNTDTFQLSRNGAPVPIRPKTAQLLQCLILRRDRVVPKLEIIDVIWQSPTAQEYALFQLISEVRKLAPDAELIRTQPNKGYQWVAPTRLVNHRFARHAAVAATLFGVVFIGALGAFKTDQRDADADVGLLPAITAYSKGVAALENGNREQAVEWFRFALEENPASDETRLLLAESLLQQNQLEAASDQAQVLLSDPTTGQYVRAAASDLMSRVYQRQGDISEAFEVARETARSVNERAHCTADIVDNRVQELAKLLGLGGDMSRVQESSDERVASESDETKPYADRCNELKSIKEKDDVSRCMPMMRSGFFVASLTPYNRPDALV